MLLTIIPPLHLRDADTNESPVRGEVPLPARELVRRNFQRELLCGGTVGVRYGDDRDRGRDCTVKFKIKNRFEGKRFFLEGDR